MPQALKPRGLTDDQVWDAYNQQMQKKGGWAAGPGARLRSTLM